MPSQINEFALNRIHAKKNQAKYLQNAVGFLRGIIADQRINPTELQALHNYMLECSDKLNEADLVDVLEETSGLVKKSEIGLAEEQDLKQVIECILEFQSPEERSKNEDLEEFLGLCSGVVADGVVKDQEALYIKKWLEDHPNLVGEWPAKQVAERLERFLADGKLSSYQSKTLLILLSNLVGGTYLETGATTTCLPSNLQKHFADTVNFEGRSFCFTGTFFYGKRTRCETDTLNKGGHISKSVKSSLDYLVVGSIGSPFWITSHFGTKIKKVMETKSKKPTFLVGEDVWLQHLSKD